jgi:ATP-binding cassette subfamily F protein 3
LNHRKIEHLNELEQKKSANQKKDGDAPSQNKLDYERRKENEREQRKVKSAITRSEEHISELEGKVSKIDALLSNPDPKNEKIASGEIYEEYENLKKSLEKEMENWAMLHEKLDALLEEKE